MASFMSLVVTHMLKEAALELKHPQSLSGESLAYQPLKLE